MAVAAKPDRGIVAGATTVPQKRPAAAAKALPPAAATSPAREPTALASRSPAEVCAGRNFFARAICVSRQCQTAGTSLYPECVEVRRIEESRQRRIDP